MYIKKIESSDLIKEVKKHQEYIKPSQKQRNKQDINSFLSIL
ncbi:30S ribosomal protein S21 [Candidatus Karelsulcia muelleri]|uniref:30S ribosomal protein S21 n=1 Tax=Candidatus Karelsulcia muelleri TaxID=336810 RepID=A0A346E138_9FLAO|nr:30S ribosomal protein S21 [Candidatus Karelsulcia muelleri]